MRRPGRAELLVMGFFSLFGLVILGALSHLRYREGTVNACEIAQKLVVAAYVRPYSGTGEKPNLLEPVAFAIARKKAKEFVAQKSQIECAIGLFQIWRQSKAPKKEMEK